MPADPHSSTFWYHCPRPARARQVCRIGHCPTTAVDGSDFCGDHDVLVNACRAVAATELESLHRGRPGTRRNADG